MPGSCCVKPITRIIKVADFEAGLLGLDQALRNVCTSGVTGEEEIKQDLLRLIRDFGNYVSPSSENEYTKALLREYKSYVARQEDAQSQKR
ncbi:MAG: hypothetical protein NTU47_02430 [Ignavibacteriales bacterium]|nr:hypothetical protein [Ignavibacteriales bacterium]